MSDYSKAKFIVAGQYPSGIWNLYASSDDLGLALKDFDSLKGFGADRYKAAAVFTREQWNGSRSTYRRHINLRDRHDESIPAGIGMWIINQADSGYF